MFDAIYTRQSMDKADSISIESQLEYCKYETHGGPYKEYSDKGYSGKNTNRPAFEAMLQDIRQGKIARVIVYKLDRISRSILDFTRMMELFGQYKVEFISSTERFDTSTPIGRAMLHICIVFAQLERETIQKRVTDAYYSRCKRGFYMGGRIPYGFTKEEIIMDGIKTSMYVPVPKEAMQLQLIYSLYANTNRSLGDIIIYCRDHKMEHLRAGMWNSARLSEILRNPVYVRADADVYEFFKSQGANMINPVSDYTGDHACYLYKGTASVSGRKYDLTGKDIVLAPHQGIISSADWIKCRKRSLTHRQSAKTCKSPNSWLAGKVKCGRCGYGLTIAKSNTKWHRYFVCATSLSTKKVKCTGTGGTVYADILEEYIHCEIRKKLRQMAPLSDYTECVENTEVNELKIRMAGIEKEIGELMTKVAGANPILMEYIGDRIETLDAEKKQLREQIAFLASRRTMKANRVIIDPAGKWIDTTWEEKQSIVDALIQVITIADGNIIITWKI